MGATPTYSWPWPNLTPDLADAPAAFAALGTAIEGTITDAVVTAFVPSWTGSGANPTLPASITGWYRREGSWCDLGINISFGASTTGGWGVLSVGLPLVPAASPPQQALATRLWIPGGGGGLIEGSALVSAGLLGCNPQFVVSPTTTTPVGNWQNASSAALTVGTGVPQVTGALTIQSTGFILIHGRYLAV